MKFNFIIPGVYYRISLGPFQRFKVQFPQELILYDHAVEFQFDFRKGPVTSSFPGEQLLVLAVQYYGYPDYGVASPIIEDRAIWETTKLSLSGWPPKATVNHAATFISTAMILLSISI